VATLYTFCAISGAGKTFLTKNLQKHTDAHAISMDNWRKRLTGDVSNQSENAYVYRRAWAELEAELGSGNNAIWDATNLNIADIKKLLALAKAWEDDMVVFVLDISAQPDVCRSRVQADLNKGVDRSKTTDGDIIDRQHAKWLNTTRLLADLKDPDLTVIHM
jgi:predicted kinase